MSTELAVDSPCGRACKDELCLPIRTTGKVMKGTLGCVYRTFKVHSQGLHIRRLESPWRRFDGILKPLAFGMNSCIGDDSVEVTEGSPRSFEEIKNVIPVRGITSFEQDASSVVRTCVTAIRQEVSTYSFNRLASASPALSFQSPTTMFAPRSAWPSH